MLTKGWSAAIAVAIVLALALPGCGDSKPFSANVQSISFLTQTVPASDAGRLYNVVIAFATEGGAAPPDRFELTAGVLPTGVALDRDREDANLDGIPDEDGAFTGNARLLGVPRQPGSYSFTIKAISTGQLAPGAPNPDQPDLAANQSFSVNVSEGTVAILTPTAEDGTTDPAVPAFPAVVPFVNPANPEAFFSFPFQIAGGSNKNAATIYGPREWELSAFDTSVVDEVTLRADVDESSVPGAPANLSKFEQNFSDGGIFVLQAGEQKVQIGGFQSPRGSVRVDGPDAGEDITSADPAFLTGLLPEWFQDAGVPKNSRRDFADTLNLSGGDNTLGTEQPVLFSDYFDPAYKSTTPTPDFEAKYPFTEEQYLNAFFVPYTVGVDVTPLMFRLIVEAIDTRGTPTSKADDVIARKAYIVRVQIPDITIDTVLLPAGQAGVLYGAQIALSGGVPPLFADLEWVDATNDQEVTAGDALTKDLFGIELDPRTWQFIGAPRAAAPDTDPSTITPDGPSVELTVRAWAQVMNPTQTGPALVPTGNTGERDGLLDPDGAGGPAPAKSGRHHTYQVNFALPTAPSVANASLKAGIDGQAYPGDRIVGAGGVPLLAPYPPGFFDAAPGASYPSASAQRAYEWSSTYEQDTSYGAPSAAAVGLPNSLTLVTSALLATNGNITGTTFDRGFLNILFSGLDFYVGNVAATPAHPTAYQTLFQKSLTLSVSPDQAVYMRGVQGSEGTGGVPSGLLDSTAQMATPLMTPILLAAGLFTVETGKTPVFHDAMPVQMDILPVLLPNGGSDAHNRKSVPSISGYWPAESNKEPYWNQTAANEAWKHSQQELTWLQAPNATQSRVFMWAEGTILNNFNNSAWTQRFQTLDPTKHRGAMVVNPSGDFFIPVILDGTQTAHGTHFGAEAVTPGGSTSSTSSYYYYGSHPMYSRFRYYAVRDSQIERRVHMHGTSTYLEPYSTSTNTSSGWYMGSLGRTATSVAMSADGIWCATALPGGSNVQKILLWRTDKQAIPAAIVSQSFATAITGKQLDATGALVDFPNSAVVLAVGGQSASGVTINANQRYLLPDSLMFVQDGLLFLSETQLDRVFGVSLVDGHLSSASLNSAAAVNSAGNGPAVSSVNGWYIPDNDYLRGNVANTPFSAQFAYAGSKPAAGEEGPAHVAFVAGANAFVGALADLSGYPRAGYAVHGNRAKTLFYLALSTGATGLDLAASTLRDLTGSSNTIYGDLLTPGRFGEELDFLALSDDGKYAAVVREVDLGDGSTSFSYRPSFHTGLYYVAKSSTYVSWGPANHDLMLISTDGSDMHSGAGTQHVLYMGTQGPVSSKINQSDPTGLPAYAVGKNHINSYSRRVNGLTFTPDNRNLIFNYAGSDGNYSSTTYGLSNGTSTGWGPINPAQTGSFSGGTQTSIRLNFKTSAGATVDFTSTANFKNNLQGLTGTGGVGTTAAPFAGDTGAQCFWATFKSEDGNFLYFISDQINSSLSYQAANRNYMVGFNLTSTAIGGRDPFTPFSAHASTIGFEQFDCNAWSYENRFSSVPGGVSVNGRDGAGILCVIASDASAGAGSATDLEVYVMDTNLGTGLMPLTSAITTGTANAINHLSMSGDGNVLAGQIAKTTANSNGSRALLNSNSDLFVVTNLHAVLAGGTPTAFVVSQAQSHGASVAFVGEGTGGGPQAIVYSSGSSGTTNTTWSTRTLKSVPLVSGAVPTVLDSTQSHKVVLAAGRRLNDNPATAD